MEQAGSSRMAQGGVSSGGWKQQPKVEHPMYTTTTNCYGAKPPTVHDMPTQFFSRTQQFSQHLGTCGMYRNFSLNTEVDKSKV